MRVHQPGSHLTQQRGADVEDWSWRTTRRRVGTLWRLTRPYRGRTGLSVISLLTATITALAPPYLTKYALDDALHGHTGARLEIVVGIFVAAGLANWGMTYVETYLTGWVGERILADLRNRLFEHLQQLSLGFYERNRAGVIISRLTNDVEAIDQLVTDGVTTLVQSTLTLGGTAVILFVLDWRLALATCAVIPLMSVATLLFRKYSARAYAAVRERLGLVTATLAEDIAGMRVLQAFTREQAARENFRVVGEAYRRRNQETVVQNAVYFPFVDLLASLATAIILGYGAYLVFHGKTSYGVLAAFLGYATMFF
ncbi:MAG: ABC transporter ATP-binding protein, partial [Acidobacteriota bacterium]|nr:ABC transporter ATP-binding protein [Acidobacteriota bacterium]